MALKKKVSRREFIRLSSVATAGTVVAACGGGDAPTGDSAPADTSGDSAPAASSDAGGGGASMSGEAPMLADLVASGDLPPVDERLPVNPAVIPGLDGIGNYGGTFRRGFKGVSDRWGPTKMISEGWTWYNPDLTVRPNIAESWEANEDATEYTIHLREGMKYSDGHPYDSASIQWWWENEVQNEKITPAPPGRWSNGSPAQLAEMSFPDSTTIVVKFGQPNPLFPFAITRGPSVANTGAGHFMAQFHEDHADDADALAAMVEESGFETWEQFYQDKRWWYLNPDKPGIGPWIAKNALSEELFLMERNPYFWQVDADGNQLPYVDKVTHRLFDSNDVFNIWITNGEIDFQARHVGIANFTLFKESEESGDYEVFVGIRSGHSALQPNQTTKNERLREFFNITEVRQALSVAVDREQIVDIIYDGLAKPRQYSPLSSSPQAYEKQETAFIQYDPDLANQLLDDAGYAEKDADGFRLWNDGSGETLSFIIEGTAAAGTPGEDEVQLVVSYFADVGVKATYQGFERSLYTEHFRANEIEAAWWGGDRTVLPIVAPWIFLGTMIDRPWGVAWGLWRSQGDANPNSEKPPEGHWIWDIWALWDQIEVEPDEAKRNELFREILDIWAVQLPQIGYVGETPGLIIVKNGVKGYAKGLPLDDTTEDEHLANTQTYYWDDPSAHM
ncbi:MAG: ABC transporter substrate-binding protein [Chloroflexota bacterium]